MTYKVLFSIGTQVVQIFTAGFSETGEDEGRDLEKEMVKKAKEGNLREGYMLPVYQPTPPLNGLQKQL